jgi:hypothetical protein
MSEIRVDHTMGDREQGALVLGSLARVGARLEALRQEEDRLLGVIGLLGQVGLVASVPVSQMAGTVGVTRATLYARISKAAEERLAKDLQDGGPHRHEWAVALVPEGYMLACRSCDEVVTIPTSVMAGGPSPAKVPPPSITCPECGLTSFNPSDIREGYCGACHDWTRSGE